MPPAPHGPAGARRRGWPRRPRAGGTGTRATLRSPPDDGAIPVWAITGGPQGSLLRMGRERIGRGDRRGLVKWREESTRRDWGLRSGSSIPILRSPSHSGLSNYRTGSEHDAGRTRVFWSSRGFRREVIFRLKRFLGGVS